MGACGLAIASLLVSQHYDSKSRGLAVSVLQTSAPLSPLLFAAPVYFLIHQFGWRAGALAAAILLIAVALPLAWLGAREPQAAGSIRRRASAGARVFPTCAIAPCWLCSRRAFPAVWLFFKSPISALALSKGFTTATGAAAVSVFGAAAAASALLFGWLSDRYGRAQILALATLTRARKIAIANGVRYAYTGNVHDQEGGSTHRHGCGAKLIGRDGYEITAWNLNAEGKCRRCGSACAGIFEASPGAWGARRQPVRLKNFAA